MIKAPTQLEPQTSGQTSLSPADERFRSAFDHAAIGMALVAPDGSWLDVNAALCSMLGYSKGELLEKTFQDLTYPDDLVKDLALLQEMLDLVRQSYQMYKRYFHKEGHIVHARLSVSAVYEQNEVAYFISQIQDISFQIRAEQRLNETMARFRGAFDYAPIGMAIVGLDGSWLDANRALCMMLGYTRDELLKTNFQALTHPEDLGLGRETLQALVAGQQTSAQFEKRYLHKSGHTIWALLSTSAVQDEQGQAVYLISHIRDISARKRAEQALRHSEETFRTLFETAPVGMALVTPEGKWQRVNEALCSMLGYSKEELSALSFQEVTHPKDLARDLEHLEKSLKGEVESFQFEKRYLHKSGRPIWALLSVSTLYDEAGEVSYFVNQMLDITERRQAEKALEQSEQRYRTMLRTSSNGVVLYDHKGAVIEHNPRASQLLGLTDEQLQGRSSYDPDWQVVHEDGSEWQTEDFPLSITLATGEPQNNVVMGVRKPGGEIAWLLVNTSPIFDIYDARPQAVVVSLTDISQRKEDAERLARYAFELERSNRDLQDFAYVASHDLQEPLRMVASYVQLLERRYKDQLDKDASEFINFAVDGANRMRKLISDLLSFSRINTQGKPLVALELTSIVSEALTNLKVRIEETGAKLSYDPLPKVCGDNSQLLRLFQNLIGNALKFSEEVPEVHISRLDKGEYWQITVRDNGIGIPEDSLERVFTPFQRLHTRDAYEGTGIGLSVCRRIVERHGGRLWLESEVGVGSSFHFTLPKISLNPKDSLHG